MMKEFKGEVVYNQEVFHQPHNLYNLFGNVLTSESGR